MSVRAGRVHVLPRNCSGRLLAMNDLLILGLGFALFALAGLYVIAVERV